MSTTRVPVICSVCDKDQGYETAMDDDVQEYAVICVACQEEATAKMHQRQRHERGPLTDEEVAMVYATLIEKSWEDADLFESHQRAWNDLAMVWGIVRVDGKCVTRFASRRTQEESE